MNVKTGKNPPHRSFSRSGSQLRTISFPLGGIGTGCIGLAGNGQLVDWEVFNKPNKGSFNQFSHFAIKIEKGKKLLDARVLHGDLQPPYMGGVAGACTGGFGFGPSRENLAGLPHFKDTVFNGEFPIARIAYHDTVFPCPVRLTAFNPFIPLNARDSGIPAAFFEFEVRNPLRTPVDCTVAGVLGNPLPAPNVHSSRRDGSCTFLTLATSGVEPGTPRFGDLTIATDSPGATVQRNWFRGGWFDSLEVYWRDFAAVGSMPDRHYGPDQSGAGNHGVLATRVTIPARASRSVRFVISWSFPTCENYWNKDACDCATAKGIAATWKNYYATIWPTSASSAEYALRNWDRLQADTQTFTDALFDSTMPLPALDAVSANLSILKSPTVMRLEDGTFYGFEGCSCTGGCCEGSCTHVWNYQQALPFLFPALERSMREADYRHNCQPDGRMPFRIQLPLGVDASGFRPCADGQFGGVMKAYRDWKICGDTAWLRSLWPALRKSIEFAWSPENGDKWDPDKTGVLHGRQHHTLDMELFGPNSWLTGFYLGALKAGAEMAEAMGEPDTAADYRAVFTKGKAWADKHLFNGKFYHQRVNLDDRSIPDRFGALDSYWNNEHKEIKYQIGEGCIIDQVLGQWHADLYGLGDLFDPRQVRTALRSLFALNFIKPMRNFYNACRIYCLNDEAGLVICNWPKDARKPMIPIPYTQEAMHGFEYAAAIHMIMRGMVEQGMTVVAAVRDRYDGEKRNPWNEFECGSNYARSMASYALLNAYAGFSFDMTRKTIGFNPIMPRHGSFSCLWSLDSGWGTVTVSKGTVSLRVNAGKLAVKSLHLPFMPKKGIAVSLGTRSVPCAWENGTVTFAKPVSIDATTPLVIAPVPSKQ